MNRVITALMLGSALMGVAATPALADSDATPQAAAGQGSSDILVTARRKSEKLIDVPSAISVLSPELMKAKGIANPSDLVHAIPSLQQSASGYGNAVPHFLIRGQRQQLEFIQSDQSVGIYIDEIAVPRQQGLNAGLFDMANIQVLKGPQGTLFGKNQTAGAILFSSQMPKRDFGGYITATGGNYSARKVEGAINVPITSDFQIRAAGQLNRRNGYVHNVTDGRDYNDIHSEGWRVSAHYAPASTPIENWLTFSGATEDEIGSLATQPKQFLGAFAGPGLSVGTFGGLFGLLSGGANHNGDAMLSAAINAQSLSYGPYEAGGISQYQLANGHNTEITNFSATNKTEFHIGDSLTLRNIVGYRFLRSYTSTNMSGVAGVLLNPGTTAVTAGNPGTIMANPATNVVCGPQSGINCVLAVPIQGMNYTKQHQISEELDLLGKALDNKLEYIIGGYYFRESGDSITSSLNTITTASRFGTAQNSPANLSSAIFGQATYHVTPTVALTGGLRQTWDKRETYAQGVRLINNYWPWAGGIIKADGIVAHCALKNSLGAFFPDSTCLTPNADNSGSVNFQKLTYTASLDWHPTRDTLLYVTTRTGYRAGGYNQSTAVAPSILQPFAPETSTDYEVGFKGNWRFDNGMKAGFNIDYYRDYYNNIQRALQASPALGSKTVTRNAAKALIDGVEIEGRFEPTNWLELSGYYSHIRAKFKNFLVLPDPSLAASSIGDFSKGKFSGVPDESGSVTITLHTDVPGNKGRLAASMDYYGQTGTYMQDNNVVGNTAIPIDSDHIPGYWVMGANVSWTQVMGKPFDVALNVRNLNNKLFYTGGVDGATGSLGNTSYHVGEPRMFTASVSYHF